MPPRPLTLGLLWLAAVALLALLGLLWNLRGAGIAADAALAVNLLLLPLPLLALWWVRRDAVPPAAAPAATEADTHALVSIADEIRTPMHAVLGLTRRALQTSLSAEQRALMSQADTASRTLVDLVDTVLDVAELEAGRARVDTRALRLEDVVTQVMARVRPLHASPSVTLVCDWADASLLGARGQLLGDPQRLAQLLVPLLSTALRGTPAGMVTLRLDSGPTDAEGRVPLSLTVQDGGGSMSAEQLTALFSAPRSTHPPAARSPAGGGLGLRLAARLAALMGGSLRAQSQAGQGCSFEINLALPLDARGGAPSALKPQRLLLAKAHPQAREATLAMLSHLGLGAGLASSTSGEDTQSALVEAREAGRPFDWLLLDWLLPAPGPTGAELLARLRRDHPALRIAVLCPPGDDEAPAQARSFGARALCPRPVLPAELRRLLRDDADDRSPLPDGQALAGLRVLLVEDHPVNQEVALRLLSGHGAQVDVTANGQQGLERLLEGGPTAYDLVLMDLHMPVLDGLEATRRLRQRPEFDKLPVLAMTAHVLPEERAECAAVGMQGHIAKPLDVALLVRELQRYRPAPQPAAEPVLDLQTGLRQFDGQAALYRRTLQGFTAQYASGLDTWAGWLAARQWAELRRAAHTLQGLAATVGARPLHHAALALERSAGAADADAAERDLARTGARLEQALGELRAALARHWDDAPAPSSAPGELAQLQQLVSQSDSRALDWWQAHGSHAGLDAATWQRLDQALAALDFDAAAAALKEGA